MNYNVLSEDNRYLLDPNKTTSLLLQSVENTLKGTVANSQLYKAASLLPHTSEKIGTERKSANFHTSFLDRLMGSNIKPQKKIIRISCGILDVGGFSLYGKR